MPFLGIIANEIVGFAGKRIEAGDSGLWVGVDGTQTQNAALGRLGSPAAAQSVDSRPVAGTDRRLKDSHYQSIRRQKHIPALGGGYEPNGAIRLAGVLFESQREMFECCFTRKGAAVRSMGWL